MQLKVIHRAASEADVHLGHLDDQPAIGTHDGKWYIVRDDAIIHNPAERLVWIVKREFGAWECIHDMHWQDQYVDPKSKWLDNDPDYVEPAP